MLTEQLQMSDDKIATAYTILFIMDLRKFKHIFLAVAILLSTAIYPQRLFCCELFVIGQS